MSGPELLERLGNPYEKKYHRVRELSDWPNLQNPLHVTLLLCDFHTELCMNGILGFLENSTGAYLDETIEVCRLIGAGQTANTLIQIREAMHEHSVSHHRLREDFANTTEFEISSFSDTHPGREEFAEAVCGLARTLYLYDDRGEPFDSHLEDYLERHSDEMLDQLESIEA
jgi:hypothetical protein